jgi:hypothetical protein
MDLNQTLQLQALKLKAVHGAGITGHALEAVIESNATATRQICARISPELYDEVSTLSQLLDMPQRQFIELALTHAVNQAHKTLEETGAMDVITKER